MNHIKIAFVLALLSAGQMGCVVEVGDEEEEEEEERIESATGEIKSPQLEPSCGDACADWEVEKEEEPGADPDLCPIELPCGSACGLRRELLESRDFVTGPRR